MAEAHGGPARRGLVEARAAEAKAVEARAKEVRKTARKVSGGSGARRR